MDQSDSVPDPGAEEAASPLPTRSRLVQELEGQTVYAKYLTK